MNLKTAKTPQEITLAGITIEFDRQDSKVTGIALTDGKGGMLQIRSNNGYTLDVLVPAPPKMMAHWRVVTKVGDVNIDETFDSEWSAKHRIGELGLDSAIVKPEKILTQE